MHTRITLPLSMIVCFAVLPQAHAQEKAAETPAPAAAVAEQQHLAPPKTSLRPVQPAAQPVEPSSSDLHTVSHWYGWQTLATDGASLLLMVAAASASDAPGAEEMAWLSLGGYLGGGPIVHLAHGEPVRALGSLALRGGLPILTGVVGSQLENCTPSSDFCGLGGAVLGGMAGLVTAMVIDSAVLANERVVVHSSRVPVVGVVSDGKRTLLTAGGVF